MKQFGDSFNDAFGTDVDFPSKTYLLFGVDPGAHDAVPTRGTLAGDPNAGRCCANRNADELESVGADMEGGQDDVDASAATRRKWRRS